MNIDVKQGGIEKDLAKLIIKFRREKSVIIDSYYPGSIVTFRELLPKATLGFSTAMEDRRDLCRRFFGKDFIIHLTIFTAASNGAHYFEGCKKLSL